MKFFGVTFFLFASLLLFSCSSNPFGKKMYNPFTGSKYESNARFWRGVGKGQSRDESIARKRAQHSARVELASHVSTTMKEVSDDYMQENGIENKSEITQRFESLSREVMNTNLVDIRKINQKEYFNEQQYTVFVAYEIKKRAMYKHLKKMNEAKQGLNPKTKKLVSKFLDEQLEKALE